MEGKDGGRGHWSYREQIGSNSYSTSSSSGTLSTAYTSIDRLSSVSMEAVGRHFDFEFEGVYEYNDDGVSWDETEKMKHLKNLVQEFHGAPPSGNCSVQGGVISVLAERWFMELDVGWVLHGASAAAGSLWPEQHDLAGRWTRALTTILGSISQARVHIYIPDRLHFAMFIQETMLKMLPFVDAIVAPNLDTTNSEFLYAGLQTPLLKLIKTLLDVRGALLMASRVIQSSFCFRYSECTGRIQADMVSFLSEKEAMLDEAIWDTMEEVRTRTLASVDGESRDDAQTRQGSPDIHKANRSLTNYIKFLRSHAYASFCQIADYAANHDGNKYVPKISFVPALSSLIWEMLSCLEQKLANKSESLFPDQSLRYLFLINNTNFMWQQLHPIPDLEFHMLDLNRKMRRYVDSYLEVSWSRVLSCLYKIRAPLAKFEAEFQKTYGTQKLWKVTDPELRGNLRKSVVEKITPGYRKYLEDKHVTTPRITPEELEEMLHELFEG